MARVFLRMTPEKEVQAIEPCWLHKRFLHTDTKQQKRNPRKFHPGILESHQEPLPIQVGMTSHSHLVVWSHQKHFWHLSSIGIGGVEREGPMKGDLFRAKTAPAPFPKSQTIVI